MSPPVAAPLGEEETPAAAPANNGSNEGPISVAATAAATATTANAAWSPPVHTESRDAILANHRHQVAGLNGQEPDEFQDDPTAEWSRDRTADLDRQRNTALAEARGPSRWHTSKITASMALLETTYFAHREDAALLRPLVSRYFAQLATVHVAETALTTVQPLVAPSLLFLVLTNNCGARDFTLANGSHAHVLVEAIRIFTPSVVGGYTAVDLFHKELAPFVAQEYDFMSRRLGLQDLPRQPQTSTRATSPDTTTWPTPAAATYATIASTRRTRGPAPDPNNTATNTATPPVPPKSLHAQRPASHQIEILGAEQTALARDDIRAATNSPPLLLKLLRTFGLISKQHTGYTGATLHTRRRPNQPDRYGLLLTFETPGAALAFMRNKAWFLRGLPHVTMGFFYAPQPTTPSTAVQLTAELLAELRTTAPTTTSMDPSPPASFATTSTTPTAPATATTTVTATTTTATATIITAATPASTPFAAPAAATPPITSDRRTILQRPFSPLHVTALNGDEFVFATAKEAVASRYFSFDDAGAIMPEWVVLTGPRRFQEVPPPLPDENSWSPTKRPSRRTSWEDDSVDDADAATDMMEVAEPPKAQRPRDANAAQDSPPRSRPRTGAQGSQQGGANQN